jgi:hypothetical protein
MRTTVRHLFNDLVGALEDRSRDPEAKFSRGVEIDDQFVFRRLLEGQIGAVGAREDPSDIGADLSPNGDLARS